MRGRKFEKVEGIADMATLVVIGALGLAMLIGLATASGAVTW